MVKVNKDVCIGCGSCAAICSAVFQMEADNKAGIILEADLEANAAQIQQAADACPVRAISVE